MSGSSSSGIRERLALFVEPEELDDSIKTAFPVIADFADRHSWIEERQRIRNRRAKRDGGTDCYPTD